MAISFQTIITFDKEFIKIRKKEYYEPIVLNIMNDSKICFPSEYKRIENQDNGEGDFEDLITKDVYDAKLLFEKQLCIALSNNEIDKFIIDLKNFVGVNFGEIREEDPQDLVLFKEIESRIDNLKNSEIGILFLPFPVLTCNSNLNFFNMCSDQLDFCYKKIKTDKKVYLIGMNVNGEIVCKELGSNRNIEFLENKYFSEWLDAELVDINFDK